MHTRRLMRGDVLRKVALEDERANVAPAQRTVDLGELTAALFRKVDGYGIARRDEAMNGFRHCSDLLCFFASGLWGGLWSKLREDAVHDSQVVSRERWRQLLQHRDLLRAEASARWLVPIRQFYASVVTAAHRFNRVGAGERLNVVLDRPDADVQLRRQILDLLRTPRVQDLLDRLPAFRLVHLLTPSRVLCDWNYRG